MGLFRKVSVGGPGEPLLVNDVVTTERFDRIVEKSHHLREAGVTYEDVEGLAARQGIAFNEALEALHAERFSSERAEGPARGRDE